MRVSDTMADSVVAGAEVVAAFSIVAAALVVPIIISNQTPHALDVKLPVVGACALVAGLALVVRWAAGGRICPRTAGMARALGLLLCAAALSTALSKHPQDGIRETWWYLAHGILFLAAAIVFRRGKWAAALLVVILLSASFVALYGWAQAFGTDLFGQGSWHNQYGTIFLGAGTRALGTIGSETALGGYMAACAILAAGSALAVRSMALRILLAAAGAGMAGCMVLSGTRSAWFAFGVGLFVLAAGVGGLRRILAGRPGKIALAALLAVAIALLFVCPRSIVRDRIRAIPAHVGIRTTVWRTALRMFYDSPVVGKGPGTYNIYFAEFRPPDYRDSGVGPITDRAHCEYLEVLAETGMFGMIPFTIFLGLFGIQSTRSLSRPAQGTRRPMLLAVVAAAVTLLVHAAFNVDTRYPPCQMLLWLLIGLAAALWPDEELPRRLPGGAASVAWRAALIAAALAAAPVIWTLEVHRPYRARVALRSADDHRKAGEYAESVRDARRSAALDPVSIWPQYELTRSLIAAGEYTEALLELSRLNRHAPHFADADLRTGALCALLDQMRPARQAFATARRYWMPMGSPNPASLTDDELRQYAREYLAGLR